MEKNKLQALFTSLEKDEKSKFPGWLSNELQGRRKEMWRWFEQIWGGKTEEQAWKFLHSEKPFDQPTINSWNTLLIKWVEEYLAICQFRREAFTKLHFLNRAAIRRDPVNLYPNTIRKSRKYLEQQTIRDKTFYQVQHELDRLDVEFQNSYPGIQIRRYSPDPATVRKNEEMAILLANMEITVRRLSFNEPLTEWDTYCMSQLRVSIKTDSPDQWPVAHLYLKISDYLQPDTIISSKEGREIVEFYQTHYESLRSDAKFTVGILLNNCLIRSFFRNSDKLVIALVFDINIWILNRSEVYGARYFYRNMIQLPLILARRTKDQEEKNSYMEKAKTFLETLKTKLPRDEQEEAYNYNLADIHFEEKNFESLAKQIYALKFKDYAYEINYLILWNKAQYELGDTEGLADRLKNLQTSLRQTLKLKPGFKKMQLNQVKYFRKLVINYRPTILQRLKDQLEEEKTINGKEWLLEKLDQKINA